MTSAWSGVRTKAWKSACSVAICSISRIETIVERHGLHTATRLMERIARTLSYATKGECYSARKSNSEFIMLARGITLSPVQAKRANELAAEQGLGDRSTFQVADALNQPFDDSSFDLVWSMESGEHMPDKKKYVEEMVRVLKPGGRLVIATWCQRSTPPAFTEEDLVNLDYLYKEWAHPYFISIEEYASLVEGTTTMRDVDTDDWTRQTIASWRHSIWAGVWDPIPVFSRPNIWYKTLRDIVCLERMRRAFGRGLMQYGMIKGVKVKASR